MSKAAKNFDLFVGRDLDDAGLDAYAFRLLCRIQRRAGKDGKCTESIPNMAKACRMSERRCQQAVDALFDDGFIDRVKAPGKTSTLTLKNFAKANHPRKRRGSDHPRKRRDTTYENVETPPTKTQDEGYPSKETPEGTSEIELISDDERKPSKPKQREAELDRQVDRIYEAYPNKKYPTDAKKAIRKALQAKGDGARSVEQILAAIRAYAAEMKGEKPRFTAHPATWFNKGGHLSEPAIAQHNPNGGY